MNQDILVFVETRDGNISKVGLELLGEANKLNKFNNKVIACLIGYQLEEAVNTLKTKEVDEIYLIDDENFYKYNTLNYASVLFDVIKAVNPNILLIGATSIGRDIAPRLSARLNTGLTADCTRLEIDENNKLLSTRPAFGGNVYWKEIKLENLLTPKASDSGKYLTFDSTKGFSFNSPIPVLPEDETGVFILKNENGNLYWAKDNALPDFPVEQLGNKQYYMLTYKDGKMKWTLNPFTLPKLPDETYFNGDKFVLSYRNDETFWSDGTVYWKDIKGTIADQPEISEDLNKALQDAKDMSEKANNNATDALAKADKALAWEDSFGVEAPGFVFIDGKIKNEDGFYYPDGRDIAQLHTDFDIFKNRYSTFEKYVIAQVQMRLTSPDYSQLSNVEYVMGNFFYNSKKRYLHIESFEVGSTIEVFKPLYNEDSGSVQGPDLSSGPIMTIYKNVSGVGDIRMLELTTGFFYKVSNKKSFELKYVGELPYGEYPG